jgi:phosphoadenosine phosphosulfate reductase
MGTTTSDGVRRMKLVRRAAPGGSGGLPVGDEVASAVRIQVPDEPTPEFMELLQRHSERLEAAAPVEILRWALEAFGSGLAMATAFGPEGCCILYFLSQLESKPYLFNLDTGYQFKETLELRDRFAERYGLEVELRRPQTSVEEYEQLHGGAVYTDKPDQCCFDRKVTVLRKALEGRTAWISGIRRDQTPDRASSPIVGWDKKFKLVKISPLANWTNNQVWDLIVKQDIPYNPLHDQGYPSIGCQPCTRPVMFGEDERSGRWSGFAKTECGLHSLDPGK